MRIPSGKTDQNIYFVAVDSTDFTTRKTGLSGFVVQRSRNGAAKVAYTTPTIAEIDATNMPGVYALLVDEDTTIAAGSDSEEYCVHITVATMAPVTRTIELYRRDTTSGSTLSVTEGDFSDILSRLTVTNSQLLIVKSDTSDVKSSLVIISSDTAHIESQTTRIHSDTITLASDLAEGDFSDILSRLTVTNSNVLIIKSDTSDIRSFLTVIDAKVSDIQSDTNVMVPIISDIQSDTNVLVTKMRGVVLATGTIGATGNTTTVIHIPDTVLDSLSDDEIKYYNVVIYDVSLDEYHARTITAWTNTGDLATVSPALPFTPEASVDLYWVFPPWASQFDYDLSDLQSLLTLVRSDTAVIEAVTSDIQSDTNVMVPVISDIRSQTVRIHSDTITLASDLAEGDFSDILSRLTVTNSNLLIVKSDTSDIRSALVIVASDTAHIESDAVRILSDTTAVHTLSTKIDSDQASQFVIIEENTSDTESALVKVYSDTTAIEIATAGGALTAGQDSKLTQIHSDQASQFVVLEQNTSDTESALVKIYSDTTAIEGAGGSLTVAQASQLAEINSQVVRIHSDTITLASDLAEGDFSDILSRLTVMQAVISDIQSDTNVMVPIVSDIQSDTSDIQSKLVALATVASDIQSDTNKLVSDATEVDTSDILSLLTLVRSDTAHIESQVVRIHSDTITLASDLAEGDFSDILSRLTVTNSQLLIVKSDTSDVRSALVKVYSDTTAIEGAGGALTATQASQLTRIQSDVITVQSDLTEVDTSDIQSLLTKIYSDTALATTAAGEPAQGAPPVSATPMDKTAYLYKAWRNKTEQTAAQYSLYADNTTTVDHKAGVSDDGTTFTRNEVATGP